MPAPFARAGPHALACYRRSIGNPVLDVTQGAFEQKIEANTQSPAAAVHSFLLNEGSLLHTAEKLASSEQAMGLSAPQAQGLAAPSAAAAPATIGTVVGSAVVVSFVVVACAIWLRHSIVKDVKSIVEEYSLQVKQHFQEVLTYLQEIATEEQKLVDLVKLIRGRLSRAPLGPADRVALKSEWGDFPRAELHVLRLAKQDDDNCHNSAIPSGDRTKYLASLTRRLGLLLSAVEVEYHVRIMLDSQDWFDWFGLGQCWEWLQLGSGL